MRRLALLLALATPALAGPGVPETPPEPVKETLHGQEVVDPFRWLEGDEEGKLTPRVASWTDAQNAYARSVLDAIPGRAKLEARLRELMEVGWVGAPQAAGPWYFNQERHGKQDQPVLYVRRALDAEPRALIDPGALDARGLVSLDWYEPSQDGSLVAFGLSRAGDENSTLHVLETASGRWLADEIPNKANGVSWLPDGQTFVYGNLKDPKDAYSRRIRIHRVGRHHHEDPILVEQHDTTWGPFAYPSRDGRWLVIGYYTSTRSNDLWVADLERYLRTGELVKQDVLIGADATAAGGVLGDTLYLHTTLDAPRGRVLAVDLSGASPADREAWREVVPQPEKATLEEARLARGVLVTRYLEEARARVDRVALDGRRLGSIELPGIGSANLSIMEDRTEAFLSFTSFNEPPSVYRVDLTTGARTLWKRPDVPIDPSIVEVKQVWYPSRDGTNVSMFLVHKKGVTPDGALPTLLYGYGGFGISLTPSFSGTLFPWFEAGGVYAVANLRGGGEYGDGWHQAGVLDKKQNVFDDFIGAAEWLIENKWTKPERLAIAGGSNGGLLTGAVTVQRPDLFRAVICSVPLLDMLRYHRFLMARFWVPEYGSAEDAAAFRFLRAYSPYHQVKEGTRYPAILFKAGENDTRVHPLHARKMAAAVQRATAATPAERPVLLWVDRDGGHGAGKPLSLRVRDVADERAFVMWQLGMMKD